MSIRDRTSCVYRYFDKNGRLLYVGMSGWPMDRLRDHATQSSFARQIARVDLEWFDTRDDARAAEIEAIRSESPTWNVAHCAPRKCRARGEVTDQMRDFVERRQIASPSAGPQP